METIKETINPTKRLIHILNFTFSRSEYLSFLAIKTCIPEIKRLWQQKHEKNYLLLVDFLVSYYQLNCIIISDFNNITYFE
jgi:hypothetical protein